MLVLVYTRDGRTSRQFLSTGDTTVGRAPVCDLVIDDPSISRRHARLRVHGDHCLLSDLGGRNGTFLNGDLVAEAEVKPGDTITLGRFPLHLERATDAGLIPGDHVSGLESPATVYRRIDSAAAEPGPGPAADSGRFLALLSTIARRLVRWRSSDELFEEIVAALFDVVAADRAFLLLPDPGSGLTVARVGRTRSGGIADAATISASVVERAMAGRVAILATTEGEVTLSAPGWADDEAGKRWFVCAPLWNQREATGALYADSPHTLPLSLADLDVVQALAAYAAAAIEQARDTDRLRMEAGRRDTDPGQDSLAP